MVEGGVGSVWHQSLANFPSIMVDILFPLFLVRRKLMKMQFFVYIHPSIANQSCKHHTAVHHDCLHRMPRFHITFAKMAISSLRPVLLANQSPE